MKFKEILLLACVCIFSYAVLGPILVNFLRATFNY